MQSKNYSKDVMLFNDDAVSALAASGATLDFPFDLGSGAIAANQFVVIPMSNALATNLTAAYDEDLRKIVLTNNHASIAFTGTVTIMYMQ